MNIKEDLKEFIKTKKEELEVRYAQDEEFAMKADKVCERLDNIRDKVEFIGSKIFKIVDRFILRYLIKIIKAVVYMVNKILDEIFGYLEGKRMSVIVSSIIVFEFFIIFSFLFKMNCIKNAQDILYTVTGVSRESILYEYNPKRSFVADDRIRFKYYIFTVNKRGKVDNNVNFVVNKNDKTVYICLHDTDKILIPYGYYVDDSSISGKYYNKIANTRYELLPYKTRVYIERYGTEKFLYTVKDILENVGDKESEFDCNPLSYVNKILSDDEKGLVGESPL